VPNQAQLTLLSALGRRAPSTRPWEKPERRTGTESDAESAGALIQKALNGGVCTDRRPELGYPARAPREAIDVQRAGGVPIVFFGTRIQNKLSTAGYSPQL